MFGFETISTGVILWIVLAVSLAGLIQGTLGFGFPFLATPMVAMVADMRTAVITIVSGVPDYFAGCPAQSLIVIRR